MAVYSEKPEVEEKKLYKKTRKVCGVGINDADYHTHRKIDGKTIWRCPYYVVWADMLKRCYNEKYLKKHTNYIGCTVCDEWLLFSTFRKWMEKQDWSNKHLDKDFLENENKVYCPEKCLFIPTELNTFLVNHIQKRGPWPLGVILSKKAKNPRKYQSRCSMGKGKMVKHLGMFADPFEAHRAWQLAKIRVAKGLLEDPEHQNERILQGIQRVIDMIQDDYDNYRETFEI